MARCTKLFHLALRVIVNNQLKRIHHAHCARRIFIEVIADRVLKHRHVDNPLTAGHTHHLAKVAQRCGRKATATHPGNSRHARVIPASDNILVNQCFQLALAGNGVIDIQARKFILLGLGWHRQVFYKPFVQRAMIFKLQGADRVRNPLNGIGLTVSEVVGRINTPLITRLVMGLLANAINDRVAQIDIRR